MSKQTVIMMMVVSFLLGACIKAKPFDAPPNTEHDGMDGPGLFSGKSGELTIYRSRTRSRRR